MQTDRPGVDHCTRLGNVTRAVCLRKPQHLCSRSYVELVGRVSELTELTANDCERDMGGYAIKLSVRLSGSPAGSKQGSLVPVWAGSCGGITAQDLHFSSQV